MPKTLLVITALMLLIAPALIAQASGNVGQSGPYARWELDNAQNPPARSLVGCLAFRGGDYLLIPKRGKPVLLSFEDDEAAGRLVGHQLKVHGRKNIGAGRREEPPWDFLFVGAKGERVRPRMSSSEYFNVDRVKVLSQSCID